MARNLAKILAATGLALCAGLAPVVAQGAAEGAGKDAAPVVQAVLACKPITDAAQRLACFDAAVGAMAEAQSKGDLIAIDRQQRQAIRREAFGFALPSFNVFYKGEKPETVDRASFTITRAWIGNDGKWRFQLETGAVWRQIDDNGFNHDPTTGSTAEISGGALGSYFMKVDKQMAIRVHRDS